MSSACLDGMPRALQAVVGDPPPDELAAALHAAVASGDAAAVTAHLLASGLLAPLWEELFWRGFFLAALTKVLPLPACTVLSSLNFAVLHLSPHNAAPLLLLSACCDLMYLRSGNLLPPLLFHAAWNSTQVLCVAVLGKETFV
jgi:membrane protease YdiL (CAAX protease family)